jgi:hypothetical protein
VDAKAAWVNRGIFRTAKEIRANSEMTVSGEMRVFISSSQGQYYLTNGFLVERLTLKEFGGH